MLDVLRFLFYVESEMACLKYHNVLVVPIIK